MTYFEYSLVAFWDSCRPIKVIRYLKYSFLGGKILVVLWLECRLDSLSYESLLMETKVKFFFKKFSSLKLRSCHGSVSVWRNFRGYPFHSICSRKQPQLPPHFYVRFWNIHYTPLRFRYSEVRNDKSGSFYSFLLGFLLVFFLNSFVFQG